MMAILFTDAEFLSTQFITDNEKATCYFSSLSFFTYIDIHILSSGQRFIPQAYLHFNSGDCQVTQDIHRGYRPELY